MTRPQPPGDSGPTADAAGGHTPDVAGAATVAGATATVAERLAAQVTFVLEVDRLKSVLRRGYVADGSRVENSAEHSWTLALMAIVLAEHAAEPVDLPTVLRMVVIHDIVEVDAGDTYIYDEAGTADQEAREQQAADRLFGLLPTTQAAELRALWDEFEEAATPEARFARALDRFAGFLLNHASNGRSWHEHGITADQVHHRNQVIDVGSPALWHEVQHRLADAVAAGWIAAGGAGAGAAGAAASGVPHQHHGTSETPERTADG